MATPAPLSTFGPQTREQFLSSVKTNSVDTSKLQQSSTVFQWNTDNGVAAIPKTSPTPVSSFPMSFATKPIVASGRSSANTMSGAGVTLMDHPVQLKEAVKQLCSEPEPTFESSLPEEARKIYTQRVTDFASRNPAIQVGQEIGQMAKDAFVKPVKMVASAITGSGKEQEEKDSATLQMVQSLMDQKKYGLARSVYDQYAVSKINQMSDLELMNLKAEHPVISDLAHGAGVMTMQFVALRNAPFLKQLGNALETKVATTLGIASSSAKTATAVADVTGGTTGFGVKALSKVSRGMVKMASTLAGDLPANFLIPALNFDYEHRPLQELPAQVLTDTAILVPTVLLFHTAGAGLSYGIKETVQAASKVAAMMRALRIPLSKEAGIAFERGVMGEADNAFSRIVQVLPEADRVALTNHFTEQRMTAEGERFATRLNPERSPSFSMGESRLAGKTGPKGVGGEVPKPNENVKPNTQLEKDALLPEISPAEAAAMTRVGRSPAGTVARSLDLQVVRGGVKGLIANPPPEVELIQPYERSIWFRNLLEIPFKKKGVDAINRALTKASTEIYSSLTPVKNLERTWAAVKQFPKQTSAAIGKAVGELDDFFKRNFVDRAQADEFARYRALKMMASRADQGFTNPGSSVLAIPNNPSAEWISTALADMESRTPALRGINEEFNSLYSRYTLDQYKGRIPDPVLDEWKQKYPDHMSFFYRKYMQDSGGNPNGKSYNFTARDYLTAIRGGEGLELSANIYDTTVRSFQRAISDRFTDDIARTVREELGVKPLKMYESASGRTKYQALLDGQLKDFDAVDLEGDLVPGLEGQRLLYSKYDNQAFLVPKSISDLIKNQREKTPAILAAFSNLTHRWQDLTTTYRASFALISNPIKDLEFGMVNTDYAVKDFLGSYLTSARDLLAATLYKDNPIQMKRLMDGSFALDDSFMTTAKGKLQTALNWMANKVGTEGWEQFVDDFNASGGSQGGYITTRTKLDSTEKGFWKALGTVFTGKDAEYSLSSVDPKFVANSGIRNFVRLKNGVMALIFDNIASIGSFLEKIPRAAETKLALRSGGKSLQVAGTAGSDITLDFTEQGSSSAVKWIRAFFPYRFTAFRGNIKLAKAAVGKGRGGLAAAIAARRILMGIVTPAIGTWYMAKKAGIWDRSDQTLQDNYWIIPTGMTYTDEYGNVNPVILTPRMGEMSQNIAPLIFMMLDHFYAKDPSAFNRVDPGNVVQNASAAVTPILRTPVELAFNQSAFYNSEIDPLSKDLPVELRRYKGTTDLGTMVSNATGLSPIQGDYALQSLLPAPFDYYKMLTKEKGEKPVWLSVGEALKIIQDPSIFYKDMELTKQRTAILDQIKKTARAKNATPPERAAATRKLWTMMKELNDLIQYREEQKKANPLVPNNVNVKNVDMAKIQAFVSASKEERKTILGTMTPEEVQYLRSAVNK